MAASEDYGRHDDVDAAMDAWARWAKTALVAIGWNPVSVLAQVIEYGVMGAAQQAGLRAVEVDEFCEIVDKGLQRLSLDERKVIIRHYMHREPQTVSAKYCRMSYDRFRDLLRNARRRMGDYLDGAKLRYAE